MVDKVEPKAEPKMERKPLFYSGEPVVASRPSRQGDPGYQLSTPYSQVTVIMEDGTEQVVNAAEVSIYKDLPAQREKEAKEAEAAAAKEAKEAAAKDTAARKA